jgi:hypothetical protein
MSVSKFRFVSPGVFVNEIDNSQLPRLPEEIGPVIIGRSLRGPMMRPVRVDSFQDFVEVFGEPVAGGKSGDVWREGNRTTPTYAAYAAQAYLRNSSPVTFVRLGGYQYLGDEAESGLAGWDVPAAYGLFVAQATSAAGVTTVNGTASLAAIIYATGSVGLVGRSLNNFVYSNPVLATWLKPDGTYAETRFVLNGVTSSINLNESSKQKYIRNVLNTNPTSYEDKKYFLGETYVSWVKESLGNGDIKAGEEILNNDANDASTTAVVLLKLNNFQNFQKNAEDASTGWIVSQHLGVTGSFQPDPTKKNEYTELQKLFRIVGLTEGEWNSLNLKVSIEEIKQPANEYTKYGTFTLSIRRAGDDDVQPQYLERYTGLNLDPSSENYIAKRIGDKYTEWSYEKSAFEEFGTYNNNSKFIRVEMDSTVDAGKAEPSLLPFGYYGPMEYAIQKDISGSGTNQAVTFTSYLDSSDNALTGATPYTASFALPRIPLMDNKTNSPVSSLSGMYWGVKSTLSNTRKTNKDYVDYVRAKPETFDNDSAVYQYLFSLDDVSASVKTNGTIIEASGASWKEGNRYNGKSITANKGIDVLLSKFNKFTVPMHGGFDGVDIKEKDPFANENLADYNHTDSYAYNSIKVAIESIADPEVVEMNLAAMPGITNAGLNGQLIEKCEIRGDSLAIVDIAGDYNPEKTVAKDRIPVVDTAVLNVKEYMNTSYGCTFFPWVLVKDTINNNKVWVPPSVVALGTFSSSQKRTELWFAPAGFNRGGLSDGAAGLPVLQTSLKLSAKDRDTLYEANINPIATFPAEGIVIFGQKTLQVTPSALDRINVRRLMIYLKKEISRMARTVLFDPNLEITWKRFLDQANPFLASVQSRFGLSEYRIILDNTTTTPDLVDRNIVYSKILLKPTRAIEFIALDFVISNTGASFAD